MPGRLEYERAIRRSELPAPSRHLALTLATWADIDTGSIPDRFQPSISVLVDATGLSKASVLTHLKRLETEGWIGRDSPSRHDARTKHSRTAYRLALPAGARSGADHAPEARSGADLELGQELTKARSGADHGLGQELTTRVPKSPESHQSPRAGAPGTGPRPLHVAEDRAGSDRKTKPKNHPGRDRGQLPLLLPVQGDRPATVETAPPNYRHLAEEMTEHYGRPVTVRHAAAVALTVLDGRPQPHNPTAYVMAAVRRDPDRHRPTSLPPTIAERRAAGEI